MDYYQKIDLLDLIKIFKSNLKKHLKWEEAHVTACYQRASAYWPEIIYKQATKIRYYDLETEHMLNLSDHGEFHGYVFRIIYFEEFNVAILLAKDFIGDDITLLGSDNLDNFEKFDKGVKKLFKKIAQEENEGKLTIYTIEHGSAKTYAVPIESIRAQDMVSDPELIENIQKDLTTFFASDELFKQFKISHRRGILLSGPPGVGKSMLAKYIATIAKVPVVQFFASQGCDTSDLLKFFEYMTDVSPAIAILEDLDSLFKGDLAKSNFLNIIDGACTDKNVSLLIIATTNHPKEIDEALIQRPSRFDRHYRFDFPKASLREEYIRKRFAEVPGLLENQELIASFVANTEKMSFAHLNEIYTQICLRAINESVNKDTPPVLNIDYIEEAVNSVRKETTNKKTAVGLAPLVNIEKTNGNYVDDDY